MTHTPEVIYGLPIGCRQRCGVVEAVASFVKMWPEHRRVLRVGGRRHGILLSLTHAKGDAACAVATGRLTRDGVRFGVKRG
ncbi:MAG: hypothetical protein ACC628_16765 [Pirellulaceae bacterium]